MQEVLSSLNWPEWLKRRGLCIFFLKTCPGSFRMTEAGRLVSSSPRFMTWGIMSNGLCLTANILESLNQDGGCSLSDILIPDAPEKYFLSLEQMQKLLYKSSMDGCHGTRVYNADGLACTLTAAQGGGGAHTGLYFVDLTKGDPKITANARCLHTRQDGSLTNFKGQNSGVLYIKEATKKGYKEAHEGDSIDLGFAGSNTRRGRVFAGVAHTVDTANTHGIVLRGGRVRRLMPRECFRLQGFSEDQIDKILAINSDAQAYKQAGNGVTVTVIEAIGRRIRAADTELHDKEEGRDVCPTM